MRILMLGDAVYPDKVGGSWRFMHDMAAGLAARGHCIYVLVPLASEGLPEVEEISGFTVFRYGKVGKGSLDQINRIAALRHLLDILLPEGWDLVNFHFAWPCAAAFLLKRRISANLPMLYTFQGPWCEEHLAALRGSSLLGLRGIRAGTSFRIRKSLEGSLLKRCGDVMVLSNYSRENLRRLYGARLNVKVMKGCIKTDKSFEGLERIEARRRLGLHREGPLIFTVRRLSPRMGLDILIESMVHLKHQVNGLNLVIGGCGESYADLTALSARLGLEGVVNLSGFIPEDKLPLYLRAADLVVMPSVDLEGFGLVTLQAMMNGTPVMGTPIGGNREVIGPLCRRLLFEGLTPIAIAGGIADFFRNRDRYPSESEVLAYYRSTYAWEMVLSDWEKEMESIGKRSDLA